MRAATNVETARNRLSHLLRLRQSFREQTQQLRENVRRVKKVPRWLRILKTVYHDYGLKHVCLILVLVLYQFLGAGIFYWCEAGFNENKEQLWNEVIAENRTSFVSDIVPLLFNNTKYLFFLSMNQTKEVTTTLSQEIVRYEKQLGIKYTDQKIKWDFWNAMLYAQTICTTIGYGHLYPSTPAGRIFTMIYAIFGIPLVLSILDDLDLEIFDLPVPIAIFIVMAWIFVCSATFCIWENDWNYFLAFYFFFISLSTIGLGDIVPSQPKYLLMLFIYIIIGLSLVSMCINLIQADSNDQMQIFIDEIQAKLERTYEAGRNMEMVAFDRPGGLILETSKGECRRRGSSLGVFRSSSSAHSLSKETVQAALMGKKFTHKSTQTTTSLPQSAGGSTTMTAMTRTVSGNHFRVLPRTLSIDDVMRMVDTEDGDILVLTELSREDESSISDETHMTRTVSTTSSADDNSSQIVVSKSFDAKFGSAIKPPHSLPISSFIG
ncbi:hypothetical protein WR25_20719 [Diploscapter pachys]|uniref:Potassium channel domain-containing protein n=1 Tax=Diploscapter pachys TaxID=2018661 RepID=A0A2A2KNT3_9BILA|nr:hypothetical protein WR25_20719 [Diploscapter pachys]